MNDETIAKSLAHKIKSDHPWHSVSVDKNDDEYRIKISTRFARLLSCVPQTEVCIHDCKGCVRPINPGINQETDKICEVDFTDPDSVDQVSDGLDECRNCSEYIGICYCRLAGLFLTIGLIIGACFWLL